MCSFVFRIMRDGPRDAIAEAMVKFEMGSLGLRSFAFILFCGLVNSPVVSSFRAAWSNRAFIYSDGIVRLASLAIRFSCIAG
jgi:hypothetical protein